MLGPRRLQVSTAMAVPMFDREWFVDARVTEAADVVNLSGTELIRHVQRTVTKALHCAGIRHSSGPVRKVRAGPLCRRVVSASLRKGSRSGASGRARRRLPAGLRDHFRGSVRAPPAQHRGGRERADAEAHRELGACAVAAGHLLGCVQQRRARPARLPVPGAVVARHDRCAPAPGYAVGVAPLAQSVVGLCCGSRAVQQASRAGPRAFIPTLRSGCIAVWRLAQSSRRSACRLLRHPAPGEPHGEALRARSAAAHRERQAPARESAGCREDLLASPRAAAWPCVSGIEGALRR